MYLPRTIVVLLVFAFVYPAAAEEVPTPDEIDKTYRTCLDSAANNLAQLSCVETATSAWDKVLNANYKAALAHLNEQNRALLKEAQRKWLHYRDADQAFRDSDWSFGNAFDARVFLADAGLEIVKARAMTLSTYGPTAE